MISPELLAILVCPVCKGDLRYDSARQRLDCHSCRLSYKIEDDIPIMLPEEAERLGEPASGGSGTQGGRNQEDRKG
ncbi:MAG: Trm112 family protein [Candidatus Eisenbacteria bacterium]|nr:Trm112 family protein [Candidatus Eisenbacteria bacterium]